MSLPTHRVTRKSRQNSKILAIIVDARHISDMSLYHTHLTDRTVLRVGGADRDGFLQNLITVNINQCTPDRCQMAALLTPQGKLAFDFLVFAHSEAYYIDCPSSSAVRLLEKLKLYKLLADVTLDETALHVASIWHKDGLSCPPQSGSSQVNYMPDPRHTSLGLRGIFETTPASASLSSYVDDKYVGDEESPSVPLDSWHANRIRHGVPEGPEEMTHGKVFPLEFGFQHMHAIDFQKGCFVGQEVTSRTHRKGALRKMLWPVVFTTPAPPTGTPIKRGERQCGEIIATHGHYALALIREDARQQRASTPQANVPLQTSVPLLANAVSFDILPGLFTPSCVTKP